MAFGKLHALISGSYTVPLPQRRIYLTNRLSSHTQFQNSVSHLIPSIPTWVHSVDEGVVVVGGVVYKIQNIC
jgi:hypothetical protein